MSEWGQVIPHATAFLAIWSRTAGSFGAGQVVDARNAGGRGDAVGLLPASRWAEYRLPNACLPRFPGAATGDDPAARRRDWASPSGIYEEMEFTDNRDASRWFRPADRKGWGVKFRQRPRLPARRVEA